MRNGKITPEEIEKVRLERFTKKVSDEEVLGVIIASTLEHAGDKIVETFVAALRDANFHVLSGIIQKRAQEYFADED